ncbi:MAG: helix-turn-helix domain-containing protein [Bacteroidota bacterium]
MAGLRAKDEFGNPDPIDIHVGGRVRLRRTLMGLSQTELANALGLTFQQVQKYERGANRISASRLYKMAETLSVPVSFFFDGMANESSRQPLGDGQELISSRDVIELVRNYTAIEDVTVKRGYLELGKALAKRSGG